MGEDSGAWVHLALKGEVYVDFGVAPVPIPIRVEVLLGFPRDDFQLSPELMAREIVAYVEERPDEYETYRPLLAELAMSVGTAAGMSGDHATAAWWLAQSARARPDDARVLKNYALALVRNGRAREALEVCSRIRALPLGSREFVFLFSVEAECRRAIDGGGGGSREPSI